MNEQFRDYMGKEAIEKRKIQREKDRKEAEYRWEIGDNEGDEHEKEYWIKGFMTALIIMRNPGD